MIEINGKVYRNLPEQVGVNKDDIDALHKQLPYNGPYNTLDDIPKDVIVDKGTYLVGTNSYTIYKYDENNKEFISLGLFGAKGDKGETGAKGETGDKGEQGIKGATGTAAGFGTPVINVTTVSAVEPATGTVTASGDDTAKVFTFDFNIPRGLDGTPGPKGDQGEKGDQGIMGPTGPKGEKGDTGNTGKAAGFGTPRIHVTALEPNQEAKGTIETSGPDTAKVFTFNLDIPRGDIGPIGPQGEQGPQGIQGIQGEIGPKGDQGIQGVKGDPNVIKIAGTTYTGTTITLPTMKLEFLDFDGTTTTSYLVLANGN